MNRPKTIEMTVEQANEARKMYTDIIAVADSLEKLYRNADFISFNRAYLETEAIRLTALLGENTINAQQGGREETIERLMGIGRYSEFLRAVMNRANMAQKDLDNLNGAIDENLVTLGE